MLCKIWIKGAYEPEFLEFDDRVECTKYIYDNMASLQTFSTKTSGFVFGYAAEIDKSKNSPYEEVALLYNHRVAGLIWIETVF